MTEEKVSNTTIQKSSEYRGKCRYKTGKCMNERAQKPDGSPHNLCDFHRSRQNQHQRKLDGKMRQAKRQKLMEMNTNHNPSCTLQTPVVTKITTLPSTYTSSLDPHKKQLYTTLHSLEQQETTMAIAHIADVAMNTNMNVSFTNNNHKNKEDCQFSPVVMTKSVLRYTETTNQVANSNGNKIGNDFRYLTIPLPLSLNGKDLINFKSKVYVKIMDLVNVEYEAWANTNNNEATTTNIGIQSSQDIPLQNTESV